MDDLLCAKIFLKKKKMLNQNDTHLYINDEFIEQIRYIEIKIKIKAF